MFVNIMQFGSIPSDKEAEFLVWFKWSNNQYAKHHGFIRRRLIKSPQRGNYAVIIEHDSRDSFMAMHNSPDQAAASKQLKTILSDSPTAQFYELVEG